MTYKLLKSYLPSDIVDYCVMPYLLPSESEWRKKFNIVCKELRFQFDYCECGNGLREEVWRLFDDGSIANFCYNCKPNAWEDKLDYANIHTRFWNNVTRKHRTI